MPKIAKLTLDTLSVTTEQINGNFDTYGYFRTMKEIENIKSALDGGVEISGGASDIFRTLDALFSDELWHVPPLYYCYEVPGEWPDPEDSICVKHFFDDCQILYPGSVILESSLLSKDPDYNRKLAYNGVIIGRLDSNSLQQTATSGGETYTARRQAYSTTLPSGVRAIDNVLFPMTAFRDVGGNQSFVNFHAGSTDMRIYVFDDSIIKNNSLDFSGIKKDGSFYQIPCLPILIHVSYDSKGYIISGKITTTTQIYMRISGDAYNALNGAPLTVATSDPYSPGGPSGGGGGGGSFDGSTGGVGLPGLPNIQVADTGFLTLYNPNVAQVKNLADYMWSDSFSLDNFKKIFADPMSAIIGLQLVPVSVSSGALKDVKIGNISTGIYMPPVTSQWVQHSCGTIKIPEYWGAYLDYNPYTSLQIYLPYIGIQSLSADDIIGRSLTLQYNVDTLSGACVASLLCGSDVLYNWQGSCGLQIPFTANTYSNLLSSIFQIGGAGIALAGASSIGAVAAAGLSALSGVANAQKNDISHGGSIGGAGGFLGMQTPYIILSRPNACIPEEQNSYIGYPSFVTANLQSLSGFTRVEEIHIENVPATKAELDEIYSLLKTGVIF